MLTHRFWSTTLNSDENVLGKQIKLGDRASTIIGVLEPSVPYPAETELMANVVTSSHHMSATMQDGRVHRMTELFGRLAPGADLEQARAELQTTHGAIVTEHKEAYPVKDDFRITAVPLRDQITSPARTVLLVLLAASGLIFVIACSNVANLILARSVRREGELAIRAALGATTAALRRTLLAESLVLCGAGALLGVLIARPMVAVLARYASRFSVRALDLTVDATLLWVGVALAHHVGDPAGVRAALAVNRRVQWLRPVERQRAHHVGHQSAPAPVRGHADCGLVPAAGRRGRAARDAHRAANAADRHEYAQRAGRARAAQLRAAARADAAAVS